MEQNVRIPLNYVDICRQPVFLPSFLPRRETPDSRFAAHLFARKRGKAGDEGRDAAPLPRSGKTTASPDNLDTRLQKPLPTCDLL